MLQAGGGKGGAVELNQKTLSCIHAYTSCIHMEVSIPGRLSAQEQAGKGSTSLKLTMKTCWTCSLLGGSLCGAAVKMEGGSEHAF